MSRCVCVRVSEQQHLFITLLASITELLKSCVRQEVPLIVYDFGRAVVKKNCASAKRTTHTNNVWPGYISELSTCVHSLSTLQLHKVSCYQSVSEPL